MKISFKQIKQTPHQIKLTPYQTILKSPRGFMMRDINIKLMWPGRILQSRLTNNKPRIRECPIRENSMEPNIRDGDAIKFQEVQYLKRIFGKVFNPDLPKYEEVILFWHPETEEGFIKRVVGLPKDVIEFKNGFVYRNRMIDFEHYVKNRNINDNDLWFDVPPNHIFVLGDNRKSSEDSRDFGPIHISRVFGIVQKVIGK